MLRKINEFLETNFAIRITRFKKINIKYLKKSNPLYIEFIGVPGVGKTTLCNDLLNQTDNCCHMRDFYYHYKNEVPNFKFENDKVYLGIASNKIKVIMQGNFHSIDKLYYCSYFLDVLRTDKVIKLCNEKYTIISDEGLLHEFSESIETLLKNDHHAGLELLSNRAIIYCYSTPHCIASNIVKRKTESGKILPQHEVESYDELVSLIKIHLDQKDKFISFLKKYDVPILAIDTANDQNSNVKYIKSFISSLQQHKQN